MIFISTIHDPEGLFLPLIKRNRVVLKEYFSGSVVACTKMTEPRVIKALQELNWRLILGGFWGEARLKALKKARREVEGFFFYCDFDKALHWLEIAPMEIISLLKKKPRVDFLILGRSRGVFATYPISWQKTEEILNYYLNRYLKMTADSLASACILNNKAADILLAWAQEKKWGSCVEWPLLAKLNGLKIDFKKCRGLTWEDPDRFEKEIKKFRNGQVWVEKKYDGFSEWEKRLEISLDQLRVIERLGGE